MQQVDTNEMTWTVNGANTAVGRIQDDGLNRVRLHVADQAESRRWFWRTADVLLGGLGLIVLAVLYPFIALAVKLNSPGPVLYRQQRIGFKGERFTCWKFRTMEPNSARTNDEFPDITHISDRRVFGVGRFLRQTFLDELPQLWNVLKGDMSLIGPRPYPVSEAAFWHREFEDHFKRYAVKPGITGLAQIRGYRGGTLDREHMRRRLKWDLFYVRYQSHALNTRILTKTLRLIFYR